MGPGSHVFCATAQGRLAKLMSRKTHVSPPIYFLILLMPNAVEFVEAEEEIDAEGEDGGSDSKSATNGDFGD